MKKSSNINDSLLFSKIISGDKNAYEQFFLTYYNTLSAYANQYVDYDDAEEIVQDVMVMLWEKRTMIDPYCSPMGYLFRSVKNLCLKKIMRDQTHSSLSETITENINMDDPDFYIAEELTRKIEETLARMPESYREAFEMNRFQKMTYNEISEHLNISPKTVDYRIQKALKILRIQLKDYLPILGLLI